MKKEKEYESVETPLPIIIVGTGHHFQRNVAPAIATLEQTGRARLVATVDILERSDTAHFAEGRHIKRNNKPLHEQLEEFKKENPLVILGHTNGLHVTDALDLLSNGYRIAIEKPYVLDADSFASFQKAAGPAQYALLEYYLNMKSVPLLVGYGEVDPQSFYIQESLMQPLPGLAQFARSITEFSGSLPRIIGDITSVEVEVLEGEGETGTVERRGVDTVDVRAGGGMIQDMATHALAPLIALESMIGAFPDSREMQVRSARCIEYMKMAKRRFALPKEYIGETYAESSFTTTRGVDVTVRLGKYVFGDRNRRGVRIVGTKGMLYMDWNSCTLEINEVPVLTMQKSYYPVLRAAIAETTGAPLFSFDAVSVAARAQLLVFDMHAIARTGQEDVVYPAGADPEDIFAKHAVDTPEELNEEDLRPEDPHNTWLTILGRELPEFFPSNERTQVPCPGCGSSDVESEFVKLGFVYKWCRNCFSLYASPRPQEQAVTDFYASSDAMKFYGDSIFNPTLAARHEQQIAPIAAWVKGIVSAHAPRARRILDFMPKYFSVWAEDILPPQAGVVLVDPVYPHKLPEEAMVTDFASIQGQTYDVISAFDVLDHRTDPDETLKELAQISNPEGLLLLAVNSGSGFEYQVLSQDSHRLVPPNRLNLLTIEAIEALLEKHGFEIIETSTPGQLDVDIVLKALQDSQPATTSRFISYLLNKRDPATWQALQEFLQNNKLSSYVRIAARKKKA